VSPYRWPTIIASSIILATGSVGFLWLLARLTSIPFTGWTPYALCWVSVVISMSVISYSKARS
jgi:hypothetical protein